MSFKLFEQGKKDGKIGRGSVILGGDGQPIHPDLIKEYRGDEVGIFDLKSPEDPRLLSETHENGVYEILAVRAGSVVTVEIKKYDYEGVCSTICIRSRSALKVKQENNIELDLDFVDTELDERLTDAAMLAVLRTYADDTRGYSLEPQAPVDAFQKQAEARTGRAVHAKEASYGRHRADRVLVS